MNKAERKRAVLGTISDLVVDPKNFDLLAGLTFERLSSMTGIDSSQISKDFASSARTGKEGLFLELIEFVLHPATGTTKEPVDELFDDYARAMNDPEVTIEQMAEIIGEGLFNVVNFEDQLFREMLLWGLSKSDERLRIAFENLYKNWIDQGRIAMSDWLTALSQTKGAQHSSDYTSRDFVVASTGLAIGLGVLGNTSATLVPSDLHRKTILKIFESWINVEEDADLNFYNLAATNN